MRRKKDNGRRRKDNGRRKKENGRRKKENGGNMSSPRRGPGKKKRMEAKPASVVPHNLLLLLSMEKVVMVPLLIKVKQIQDYKTTTRIATCLSET